MVKLKKSVKFVFVPEQSEMIKDFNYEYKDNGESVVVTIIPLDDNENPKDMKQFTFTLWEERSYREAGDFTQSELEGAIIKHLTKK